jgi:hypothetical protein
MLPPIEDEVPIPPENNYRGRIYGFDRLELKQPPQSIFVPGAARQAAMSAIATFKKSEGFADYHFDVREMIGKDPKSGEMVKGVRIWRVSPPPPDDEKPLEGPIRKHIAGGQK